MAGSSGFQGILYTNGGFSLGNGTSTMGSVFADYGSVIGDGQFQVTNTPPYGALGVTTTRARRASRSPRGRGDSVPAATGCS